MKKILKIYTCLLVSFLCSCSNQSIQKAEDLETINKAQNSKLIVLDIYHNRCESCKYIEPVIKKLKNDYSKDSGIAFLKYDLSNPFTIFRSRKIAKKLGLENIYKSQRFSGVILFIDNESKQVLDTLVAEYNVSKYLEVINKNVTTHHL